MKKYLLLLFSINAVLTIATAQPQHEVTLAYAPLSSPFVGTDLQENIWNAILLEKAKFSGFYQSVNFTYRIHFDKISYGITNGISGGEKTGGTFGIYGGSLVKHLTFFTCFEPTFYLRKTENFQLYAMGGIGIMKSREEIMRTHQNYTYRWLTMQLTPVGVRLGKKAGIFAEIGVGYKGLVNVGTSLQF